MHASYLLLALLGCRSHAEDPPTPLSQEPPAVTVPADPAEVADVAPAADPWAEWVDRETRVADGFRMPVGQGWSHPRTGRWTRSTVGSVLAPAGGVVVHAEAGEIELRHIFYENHERFTVVSRFAGTGLTPTDSLRPGDVLESGAPFGIATSFDWQLVVQGEAVVAERFVTAHAHIPVPQEEESLAVVDASRTELRLYRRGVETARYRIGLGQGAGPKQRRGDNRTPVGMYFVVAKSTGPFDGPVADYYGGHWTKINYPNPWDARRGLSEGLINDEQARSIRRAWEKRRLTLQDTRLGGGIGLHGWSHEWSDGGDPGMSWGCVVNHLSDVAAIYAALPVGSMVITR